MSPQIYPPPQLWGVSPPQLPAVPMPPKPLVLIVLTAFNQTAPSPLPLSGGGDVSEGPGGPPKELGAGFGGDKGAETRPNPSQPRGISPKPPSRTPPTLAPCPPPCPDPEPPHMSGVPVWLLSPIHGGPSPQAGKHPPWGATAQTPRNPAGIWDTGAVRKRREGGGGGRSHLPPCHRPQRCVPGFGAELSGFGLNPGSPGRGAQGAPTTGRLHLKEAQSSWGPPNPPTAPRPSAPPPHPPAPPGHPLLRL